MRKILLLITLLLSLTARAQRDTIASDKITTTANMIGVGHTNVLDDYISNEKYRGAELRFVSMTDKYDPKKQTSFYRRLQLHAALPDNRAKPGSDLVGMINYALGWYKGVSGFGIKDSGLKVLVGGLVDMNFGGIYNTRGGNNCGQLRAYMNISPSAVVSYDFRLWNRTFTAQYGCELPLVGLMFSPNYGQSYYEIFTEKKSDHNIVVTTVGSAPSFRQMLTLDIPIRTVTLRVGYLGDYQQSHVNGIKTHIWTNGAVLGIVKRFKLTKIR